MQGQVTCLLKLLGSPDSDIQLPLVVTASADATLKVWDPMKIKEPGMNKEATCVQVSLACVQHSCVAAPACLASWLFLGLARFFTRFSVPKAAAQPNHPPYPILHPPKNNTGSGGVFVEYGVFNQCSHEVVLPIAPTLLMQTMTGHGGTVTAVARVGDYLVTGSTDCKIFLWRAEAGREAAFYPWFEHLVCRTVSSSKPVVVRTN
eukprot:6269972-Pyramimonas_sp.AAC.1